MIYHHCPFKRASHLPLFGSYAQLCLGMKLFLFIQAGKETVISVLAFVRSRSMHSSPSVAISSVSSWAGTRAEGFVGLAGERMIMGEG